MINSEIKKIEVEINSLKSRITSITNKKEALRNLNISQKEYIFLKNVKNKFVDNKFIINEFKQYKEIFNKNIEMTKFNELINNLPEFEI